MSPSFESDSMLNEDSEPSHSQPIEILLVDDHPLVRQFLRDMIERYDDLRSLGRPLMARKLSALQRA